MMLAATLAFFACAWPVNFLWFFGWRFLSGIAGGALMVLAAPTVMPRIPPARRGIASGAIFMGVGLGIAASGTLVPLLLHQGLTQTWIGLGIISLLLTLIAWTGWPHADAQTTHHAHHHRQHPTARLWTLYAEYGLNAFGLVPHMVFLVAFVATGLHQGLATGAEYWVLFGLGAVVGPLLSGHLADRTGFGPALRLAYLIQALAIGLVLTNLGSAALMISSFIVGAFTPGIVPLVLGRVQELLAHHPAAQKTAWSRATTSFALLQAVSAYIMSFLFDQSGGNFRILFACGTAALVLALAVNLIAGIALSRRDP
jgi:predicted MFS family arabinose efflux permease